MPHRSVYCISSSHAQAQRVAVRLNAMEFPHAQTSALFLELENAGPTGNRDVKPSSKLVRLSKPPSRSFAQPGGTSDSKTIEIPGVGRLVAFGPVAAILNDAATYGIAGGLREFGVPELEAGRYETRLKDGDVFLAIRTENPDNSDQAREIFVAEGTEDIRTLMDVLAPKTVRRRSYSQHHIPVG